MLTPTDEELIALRSIPLYDVMEANGHRPVSRYKDSYVYHCPNPNHKDTDASFNVDALPKGGQPYACFHCFGCPDMNGMGAIELQAKLWGVQPQGSDYIRIITYLARHFDVPVNGLSLESQHYVLSEPVSEFTYVEGEWTDAHLKALGCVIQPVFHPADKDEPEMASEENVYSWSMIGERWHRTPMATTAAELGADIKYRFGLFPLAEFTLPAKQQVDGTMRSFKLHTSESFPVFAIRSVDSEGKWRIKKYEPFSRPNKDGRSFKWTWWYQGNANSNARYRSSFYGDVDALDALYNKDVIPQDTSLHHDHPVIDVEYKDESGQDSVKRKFKRIVICSGPRDAMQVFYHSNCHVVYPHSETANIDERLVRRLFAIASEVYILFDADTTGVREARELNLRFLNLRNIELPSELANYKDRRTGRPCKDVSGFFEYYRFSLGRKQNIDDCFEAILNSTFPIMFWSRSKNKHSDKFSYALEFVPMTRFLSYSGIHRVSDRGNTRFARIEDNIVEFIPDKVVTNVATGILERYVKSYDEYSIDEKSKLINKIQSSTTLISNNSLYHLSEVTLNFKCCTEFVSWFPFRNGMLRVEADKRTLVDYSLLDFYVNKEQIMDIDWEDTTDEFSIELNPAIEELERAHRLNLDVIPADDASSIRRENERWTEEKKLWEFQLSLVRPMNECCDFLQFLYDTGRAFWQDEMKARCNGGKSVDWLDPERHQFQDMQFVNKVAAIGYVLSRYRSDSAPYIAYVVDYSVADEGKSTGRTGKSIIGNVMSMICRSCLIPGTGFKDSADMLARNFKDYDYLRDGFININDVRDSIKPRTFYNFAEGQITKKNLHKDEVEIPKDMCAKIIMSSNHIMNLADDSTRGRMWLMYVGDYYHEAKPGMEKWNPHMKFHHDLGSETDYRQRIRIINFLVKCVQVYLALRRKVEAPVGEAGMRRILYAAFKGSHLNTKFIKWADLLFANGFFFGIPLPKQDLVISWLQFAGANIDRNVVNACKLGGEFQKMLDLYCEYSHITINPTIVLTTKREKQYRLVEADAYVYDVNPPGTPFTSRRSFRNRQACYFFYRVGEEPASFSPSQKNQSPSSDPACDGYII